MNGTNYSIAIDGPSGAGKSTLSRLAADIFGFIYVDTGALYRTIGLAAHMAGIDSKDEAGVTALLPELDIQLRYDDNGVQRMYLNGMDVSDKIRTQIISIYASDVSAMPPVREFLLDMQRNMAKTMNVIMDGRDIGTVVLPDADLKIFLTATPEDRAMRRFLELQGRGDTSSYEEVLRDIQYRDKNDSSRETAPLKPAPDAVIMDTTGNTLHESLDLICSVIREKLNL
ncbi:MAG TPA: (d)CMP kinase [Clostridiales bacterium]|nr:(d)CMP kinase [Clostridiales bacterium]